MGENMDNDTETIESNGKIELHGRGIAGIEIKLPVSFILDHLYAQDPKAVTDWMCEKFHMGSGDIVERSTW